MHEHRLSGCRIEPLGSYLKALGILRLVAEQIDPAALGWWHGDEFRIQTLLSEDELISFFTDQYAPTPLLAPWNKGSGFGEEDEAKSPKAVDAVTTIAESKSARLASYRSAIEAVQALRQRRGWYELSKEEQVALSRNVLPDACVAWMDATVVLTVDSRVFPPLLGTGGNDGRFDFGSNFMHRIADLVGLVPRAKGAAPVVDLLREAVFDRTSNRLDRSAIGQFDPGGAGGPSSSPMGSAESLSNPWDFVLLLEGSLVFTSAAARRLSGRDTVGVPFIVSASGSGHASSVMDENSRGELWAPLWDFPTSFAEIARLISEGRADFRGRQASTGLDLARSLATLGVDRGVTGFVRHGFLERNGLATFAVPLGRVAVTERPAASVLGQIDRWVNQVRYAKNPPESLAALLRRLDHAQFAVAAGAGSGHESLQDVLTTVAAIERLVQSSSGLRTKVLGRLGGLTAREWIPLLDDGSDEFELAVALASMRRLGGSESWLHRLLMNPTDLASRPPLVRGLGTRPLPKVLAECLVQLALGRVEEQSGSKEHWLRGALVHTARLKTAEAFLHGETDDDLLGEMLSGCLVLDWKRPVESLLRSGTEREAPVHPALAVLAPFFHPGPVDAIRSAGVADRSWPRLLASGAHERVLESALHRLRIAGLDPLVRSATELAKGVDSVRLAASCLIPLNDFGVRALMHSALSSPPESHYPTEPLEV